MKNFLKPNRKKIIILVVLFIIVFVIIISFLFIWEQYRRENARLCHSYKIKSGLSYLRAEGELFAEKNDESYSGFCESTYVKEEANDVGECRFNKLYCNDNTEQWATCASFPNTKDENDYFCVDSKGEANEFIGNCDEDWKYTRCPI